jgi:hypothetical protein
MAMISIMHRLGSLGLFGLPVLIVVPATAAEAARSHLVHVVAWPQMQGHWCLLRERQELNNFNEKQLIQKNYNAA